ncbi:MAG: DUF4391 domain-containing protein [Schleiferiaceae bacterium]|nr:DUF4391 domain-containing protein [Schleiferiaceae bacterium]
MKERITAILQLPGACVHQQRLTKAFLNQNFPLRNPEKKLLEKGIAEMQWLASIKPACANVPPLEDEHYSFEEIQVILVAVKDLDKHGTAAAALLHKHIPYQLLLAVYDTEQFFWSLADKKRSKADGQKRVVEQETVSPLMSRHYQTGKEEAYHRELNFARADKTHLGALYRHWWAATVEMQAARRRGSYQPVRYEQTERNQALLREITEQEYELNALRAQMKKLEQMGDRVALNSKMKKCKDRIKELENQLKTP